MDTSTLVAPDINEGRKLVDLLRRSGIPISAALWEKDELGRWDFVLVSPIVDEAGGREAFTRIDQAIAAAEDRPRISTMNMYLHGLKSLHAKGLRKLFRNSRDRRFYYQTAGNDYVEEGYVYFVC